MLEKLIKDALRSDFENVTKNAPQKEDVWDGIQKRINSDITTAPVSDSETE